ncbi:hypothetical protein N6H14_28550 [Paenibacillus sp. CC-CFT747]|nr:hypothetical protein N6H14_28550 [Paenibacillus sp. CC-CFT747]
MEAPPWSLTEDFLRRLEGKDSRLTHKDVLQTCRAAVEADEKAVFLNNVHQPIG